VTPGTVKDRLREREWTPAGISMTVPGSAWISCCCRLSSKLSWGSGGVDSPQAASIAPSMTILVGRHAALHLINEIMTPPFLLLTPIT
jgi:hypothetical protein